MKKRKRISEAECNEILALLNQNKSMRYVAKALCRNVSSISRKIKRNGDRKKRRN
ncbi:MAG: helix-turn-helix domain-containing protein [Elusimicrobiota bacterium]|nr:helix-turn-helix domain-containing protein [Elusimicrobiota bacterium]